jgi:hypothetical protein
MTVLKADTLSKQYFIRPYLNNCNPAGGTLDSRIVELKRYEPCWSGEIAGSERIPVGTSRLLQRCVSGSLVLADLKEGFSL